MEVLYLYFIFVFEYIIVKGIEEVEDEGLKAINEKEFKTMEDKLRAAGIPSL
jgi:hypothetical protein